MALKLVVAQSHEFAPPFRERLQGIETEIATAEGGGLRARWEFGKALLSLREGKKLPAGTLDKACAAVGIGKREVQQRLKFAEKFTTEARLRDSVAQWPTWHAMCREGLPTKRTPKPKTSAARLAFRHAAALIDQIHASDLEEADLRAMDTIIAELTRIKAEQEETSHVAA